MLVDIVTDTNILMHADNFQEPRQVEAKNFLIELQNSETLICLDEGFHIEESKNRSHIGSEYLNKLNNGMLGYAIIAYLASNRRIKSVARKVPTGIAKKSANW